MSMSMSMMFIRKVWMPMPQRLMRVHVRVRFRPGILRIVVMLMMDIMYVPVVVGHPPMRMFVIVTFAQVQPKADSHQDGRGYKPERQRFVEEHDGNQGSRKRRY